MEKEEKTWNQKDGNKKIFILVVSILVVMLLCYVIMNFIGDNNKRVKNDVDSIIKGAETKVVYIWNSDSNKCKDCKKIKSHLDQKKINYTDYDVMRYSKSKYEKMLINLSINPSDFNYPAVIYIKDGFMYSNIINITDTKTVDNFIKEYQLQDVK